MDYDFSERVKNLSGNAIREIFKVLGDKEMISFAGGMPAAECLPAAKVREFADELLSENPVGMLQYGATEGYMPLRRTFLDYVKNVGIEGYDTDNALVVSGGQQGIDLMFKAMTNEGDVILVQNPTYLAVLHIAKTYRLRPIGFDCGEDGADVDDLERKIAAHKPKIVYIVPNFSNPTGKTLKVETRKKIVEIAEKYNVVVIEDDPYGRIRFAGEHLPSIKSFDKNGHVLYLTSISKTIAPRAPRGACRGRRKAYTQAYGVQAGGGRADGYAHAGGRGKVHIHGRDRPRHSAAACRSIRKGRGHAGRGRQIYARKLYAYGAAGRAVHLGRVQRRHQRQGEILRGGGK